MKAQRIRPIAVALVIVGVAAGAFLTRQSWLPYVFPSRVAKDDKPKPDEHGHEHPTDRIKLSEQAQQNLGLEADTLIPREYWRKIVIPAVVVDRPGESDRCITSHVNSVVVEIIAKRGENVKPGAALFKLESVSELLQSAQIELSKAGTDLSLAVIERDRIANLVKLGTTPPPT